MAHVCQRRWLACDTARVKQYRTIFKGFVCHLQEHTLLRIHSLSLTGRDRKKRCVEVCNIVIDEVTTFDAGLDFVSWLTMSPQAHQLTVPFRSSLG